MEITFSKERVGLRFNTHVLYYPLWSTDKGHSFGDIYFEGKNAFKELKKYCLSKNYTTVTIQEARKQKIYNF